ncbi:hypothetical protein F0562_010605 [Nyssa sinensis]|uniref:Glutamate receptor n=1 Tax=Nyssa sinensis TaxID=561372 RepID=A0A5J5A1B3_9ASTE|nr:hypothetical protein F0562_010605 [Nyssa sinensis]
MDTFRYLFVSFIALGLFFPQATASSRDPNKMEINHMNGIIGAIVDNSSRIGKEARVAMEMAIDDFNNKANQSLVLQIRNSQGDPVGAVLAARDLINTQQVQAILGPHTWEESALIADVGSQAHVPILSLADSTPQWATMRWPFLLQASPSQHIQMNAVAAIVQSWGWRRVTVIYEDNSAANGVISHLSDALREIGTEINQLLGLPPFTSSLSEDLEKLKRDQCRVFVVHTSLPLAIRLFRQAKRMEMMGNGYVWITTDSIMSLVHSINASSIYSMQGILGVKGYFQESGPRFQDFNTRFRRKFSTEHPEEENHEPGIFAVQAYDATWAVAPALVAGDKKMGGNQLLEKLMLIGFTGLNGKLQFTERKLAPAHIFQIVNVIGKSYRELGFWSQEVGFSERVDQTVNNSSSMENLGQVFWPGGPRFTPRGWTLQTSDKPLRIGVPTGSPFKQFVNVAYDDRANTTTYTGFSIRIFEATMERLPYYLPYEFFPFTGTYDDLVKQVYLKNFDAVAGDVAIVGRRCQHAEFTHPYTESGLVMIVPVQPELSSKAWLFMKPFTKAMWVLILLVNIYNGFAVWLIERDHCPELRGSALNQIGTLLSLAFTTLFSLQGERLHSNLSRMAMVVWLFVALIITQSYTASLSSMLTVQRLEPTIADIETLKSSNAMVGYCKGSYVARYLMDVLHLKPNNIKNFAAAEEYVQAFREGEIAAAFLDVPFAKVFLAKYCKRFTIAGPTYKVGGFGFVFPKGSPVLADVNEALLNVSESGVLRELENSMTGSEKCVDVELAYGYGSLNPGSFWVLFIFTGGTSTAALAIYVILVKWKFGNFMLEYRNIWTLILAVMKHWRHQRRRFSRRVSDVGYPTNSWTQV